MVWTKLFRALVHLFGAIFLHPLPSSMFVSFAVDSMIEETMCTRIFGTTILVKNLHVGTKGMDIHAVAVLKSDVIVGHIPRAISAACYVFLGRAARRAGSTK